MLPGKDADDHVLGEIDRRDLFQLAGIGRHRRIPKQFPYFLFSEYQRQRTIDSALKSLPILIRSDRFGEAGRRLLRIDGRQVVHRAKHRLFLRIKRRSGRRRPHWPKKNRGQKAEGYRNFFVVALFHNGSVDFLKISINNPPSFVHLHR